MNDFIGYILENISPLLHSLPYDSLLYAKQETNISSILASYGNLMLNNIHDQYYRTEVKNIDIARINTGDIVFACECKYLYTSDINKLGVIGQYGYPVGDSIQNLILNSGATVNYLEYELLKAFGQINNYTIGTSAIYNKSVLVNLICAPHGTNGRHVNNSGIKYFDPELIRIDYDNNLLGDNNWQLLPEIISNLIGNFPILGSVYTNLNLQFGHVTPMVSLFGFNYYIVTLAYEA